MEVLLQGLLSQPAIILGQEVEEWPQLQVASVGRAITYLDFKMALLMPLDQVCFDILYKRMMEIDNHWI